MPETLRVLHSALMSRYEPGIYQQMSFEKEAAQANGLQWNPVIFTDLPLTYKDPADIFARPNRPAPGKLLSWTALRRAYYHWLRDNCPSYDLLLLRHSPYDPYRASFIARSTTPIATVHHTLEIPELAARHDVVGGVQRILERTMGTASIRRSDAIIGVTSEVAEYESGRARSGRTIPTHLYPNGICMGSVHSISDLRGNIPEIVFIAGSFHPWQGLDTLLAHLGPRELSYKLHIVGKVPDSVRRPVSDPRVFFHGALDEARRGSLLQRAWLGLSSLALERKGMSEACPLKVREYLAAGVPVLGNHRDVFPSDFAFFTEGPPNMAPVVECAIRYRSVRREDVRHASRPYIDKSFLMKNLLTDLCGLAKNPYYRNRLA